MSDLWQSARRAEDEYLRGSFDAGPTGGMPDAQRELRGMLRSEWRLRFGLMVADELIRAYPNICGTAAKGGVDTGSGACATGVNGMRSK